MTPDYTLLAARLAVSSLHKETLPSFSAVCSLLAAFVHPKTGAPSPMLAPEVNAFVQANAEALDGAIRHERDFDFDYFGFKTLERSYLTRDSRGVQERPQHLFMRVAVGLHQPVRCIHKAHKMAFGKRPRYRRAHASAHAHAHAHVQDLRAILETYDLMSRRYFTHATPTLFNAGTPRPQLSSCFLVHMKEDSIEGIFDTLKTCACISKFAGGIGLSVHNIRATNSHIRGTNGSSNGLVPMLKVFSDTAR